MSRAKNGRASKPTIGNNYKSSRGTRALAVCAVISVTLFTVNVRMGQAGPLEQIRSGFSLVTSPVRFVGALLTTPFKGVGNVVVNLTADQSTLSELKEQNAQLQAKNSDLEEAQQEAKRLQALLDLSDTNNLQSTAARVVSGSTDSWSTTITINKGSAQGLSAGMPVTSASGIVGQITSCGPTTSTVLLLSDESSSISAMIQSSRAQGMLRGSASGQLSLTLVRTGQEVVVGDIVVTSGLGGVFPKGLPLGKVTSVESNPGSPYQRIFVEPISATNSYEEVLVITSLTEEQQASADEASDADKQETATSNIAKSDSDVDSDTAASDTTVVTKPSAKQ